MSESKSLVWAQFCVEQKVYLSMGGLVGVMTGIVV